MDLTVSSLAALQPLPALYRMKQRGVAAVLGPLLGLWHSLTSPPARGGRDQQRGHGRARQSDKRMLRVIDRLHEEALTQDYAQAEEGLYPKSLIFALPGWHDVRFLPEALLDAPQILRRKRRGEFRVERGASQPELPDYYLRTFHWQTDGWLSARSARIYELQVEFLFFGTMDVMRRRGLAALARGLRGRARPRILDVACGTGRLLEQARAAIPDAELEGVDLSPYYAARASARLGKGASRVRVANAEDLGGEGGLYDAVTCGFLFHELPKDVRRRVARELFRVVKPGGIVMVQDSMQRMDPNGIALDSFIDWFPLAYHEPYYKGYAEDDLAVLLADVGFRVEVRDYVLFSKVVVARKAVTQPEA